MDWVQGLFNLLSACAGGAIAILGLRLNARNEARVRASDGLAELYTDFMVAFHTALCANEDFYEIERVRRERGWSSEESEESRRKRTDAEQRFREATWRLRVRERDSSQKRLLEEISSAFDSDIEEFDMRETIAEEYPQAAAALRTKATAIVDRMQVIHGDQRRPRR